MRTQEFDEMHKKYGWNDNNPPPLYVGDCGWSMERARRQEGIYEVLDANQWAKPPRQADKGTLVAFRALIDETENAIRNNPETRSGSIITQSKFFQELLGSWFDVTKEQVAPIP